MALDRTSVVPKKIEVNISISIHFSMQIHYTFSEIFELILVISNSTGNWIG